MGREDGHVGFWERQPGTVGRQVARSVLNTYTQYITETPGQLTTLLSPHLSIPPTVSRISTKLHKSQPVVTLNSSKPFQCFYLSRAECRSPSMTASTSLSTSASPSSSTIAFLITGLFFPAGRQARGQAGREHRRRLEGTGGRVGRRRSSQAAIRITTPASSASLQRLHSRP